MVRLIFAIVLLVSVVSSPSWAGPRMAVQADGSFGPSYAYLIGWNPSGEKIMVVRVFYGSKVIGKMGDKDLPMAFGFFPKDKNKDILYFDTTEEMVKFIKEDSKIHMK